MARMGKIKQLFKRSQPGPDLGGARGARAPGLPPTGGLPPNPSISPP